jgi:hypothetical protein
VDRGRKAFAGPAMMLEENWIEVDGAVAARLGLFQEGFPHAVEVRSNGGRRRIGIAEAVDDEENPGWKQPRISG